MISSTSLRCGAVAALCLLASSAMAQNYTFKVGAGRFDARATSDDLQGKLPSGASVPAGVQLEVHPASTLLFSVTRTLNDCWDVELALGLPPKSDVTLRVSDATKASSSPTARYIATFDGKVVSTIESVSPTLFLNHKFLDASSALRPFVGVGVNYTHFKAKATDIGTSFYQDGPVHVDVTDSIGFAFQLGASYKIDKAWSLNAAWQTAAVKNSTTITTAHSEQNTVYRFHPSVFALTVGYQY